MKKLLFGVLTAFGVALGANAAIGTTETTFEKTGDEKTDDTTVSVQDETSLLLTNDYWSDDGKDTGVPTTSKVMKYGTSGGVAKSSENGGFGELGTAGMTTPHGTQYLEIDADSVLLRNNTATLSDQTTSYYIDTMVKFTATDLPDSQMAEEIAEGEAEGEKEKIVVWMYQPSEIPEGSTEIPAPVLKVAAGRVDSVDGNSQASVSPLTYTAIGTYMENKWYRLSVKAINKAFEGAEAVCFVVCIDGKPLTYDKQFYKDGVASIFATPSSMYRSLKGSILPSRVQGNGAKTLTGLGFKGNGAVDNILFSSAAPCDKLIDGSAVMLFKVGEEECATWEEAVNAALTATGDTTIKLLEDNFTDSEGTTTHLKLDFADVTLNADKMVVLNLNGKILTSINGTSIEILGNAKSTGKATVQIVDKVGGANVQGDVFVSTCHAMIGDASENSSDKGVVYGGALSASEGTIKLYKGKFSNDPTVPGEGYEAATVANGYELVKQGDYWTIAKVTLTEYDLTVTVVGEGVASVTVKTNGVVVQDFTSGTPIKVIQDAKVTITTTVADWYKAVDPQEFDMPAESKGVTISTTKIASSDIGDENPAADAGIEDGYFASESATKEEVQNVVRWAIDKGVSIAVVNLMNFESPTTREEAYLLNCANTEDAVTAAKAEFKITVDFVNGEFTPTWPTGYNGNVQKKGATKIGANADWTEVTKDNQGTFKFFRAILTK